MIVIAGVAFVSGVVTFLAAVPYSLAAALVAAPMVGSFLRPSRRIGIALQAERHARVERKVEVQIDEAVASLRAIAAQARGEASRETSASGRNAA